MRFLVDAQLPPRLAPWLVAKGHDAWHVSELGLTDRPDAEIMAKAAQLDCIVVTKDADFARMLETRASGQVLWLRVGNSTVRALIASLTDIWPDIERALADGQALVEVSR